MGHVSQANGVRKARGPAEPCRPSENAVHGWHIDDWALKRSMRTCLMSPTHVGLRITAENKAEEKFGQSKALMVTMIIIPLNHTHLPKVDRTSATCLSCPTSLLL